jgi:3alpha(or 20beta)-hydroxysteroid dehydrogenase
VTGRLEGKVAIVTGGARGSGEAIVARFAAEGAQVVVADVRDQLGEALAARLSGAVTFMHCDVSSEADWRSLADETLAAHGRIDVLVNNAAVLLMRPLSDTTVEDYERVFRVNELGTFLGIRAVTPAMAAAGGGSIVNVSSIDGLYVAPLTGAYAASKFAVRGLAKVAALELGRSGIRVNCICPAAGNPEMVLEALPESVRAAMSSGPSLRGARRPPPVGRHGSMVDVAWAAVFLASDESGYMTGTEIVLDGGATAGMDLMAQLSPRSS